MPLLFSLAIHNALQEVREQLHPKELLFAFLDNVYAVAAPDRIRPIYDQLGAKLFERAGIRLHTGKTHTWNRAGQRPPDMEDFGPEVWSQEGVKILGTPLGCDAFIATSTTARLEEEAKPWEAVSWVSDPQCAWQIVLQCAGPRCHHCLRTVAPSQSSNMPNATTRECEGDGQLACHCRATGSGAANRHAPDEVGRTWTPVSKADGTRRILGVLGGCDAHALRKIAIPDRSDHRTFREWRRWMPLPPRTDRVHSSS